MRIPGSLLVLILLFIAQAVVCEILTPFGENPDESGHYDYARYIRSHGKLPPLSVESEKKLGTVIVHPPLYYAISSSLLTTQPRTLRYFSIALGVGILIFIWRLARLLFPEDFSLSVIAAGVIALNPQFAVIHSSVSNLALTNFFAAAAFYFSGCVVLRRASWMIAVIWMSVCYAALTISGIFGIAMGVPLFLSIWMNPHFDKASKLRAAIYFFLIVMSLAGWWFLRNWILYGDPLGFRIHHTTIQEIFPVPEMRLAVHLASVAAFLHASFWAYFGPMRYHAGIGFYAIYAAIELCAIAGLRHFFYQAGPEPKRFLWLMVFSILLCVIQIFVYNLLNHAPQGRYLFVILAPFAVVMSAGLYGFIGKLNWLKTEIALLALMAALSVYSILTVLYPAYH